MLLQLKEPLAADWVQHMLGYDTLGSRQLCCLMSLRISTPQQCLAFHSSIALNYGSFCTRHMQVDEVKNIMSENIEKVLERGEKLDLLVDKTDNLMFEVGCTQVAGVTAMAVELWCRLPEASCNHFMPASADTISGTLLNLLNDVVVDT